MWNHEHVRAVQIDVPETLDIADRAEFYDHTGAVLDMLVTHLFQVAAEVAMEPPASLDAADLQAARETVINCVPAARPGRGGARPVRRLPVHVQGVAADSRTDTFVAARLWIDTDRWRGVPFLLRTGKRLASNGQRVSLLLREPAGPLASLPKDGNVLSFSMSGSGAINLTLVAKRPGPNLTLDVADATIALSELPDADPLPPYVRLIHDVLLADRSLFTRPDGLAAAWHVAEPLLRNRPEPQPYPPGSWGPAAAADLAAPDGWLLGQ